MDTKNVWKFIFEMAQLRRIKHEGWRLAGVDQPESVAEHSLRAAQIAYLLACLENYPDPAEVAAIAVFHDMEECRIGDIHRVASRYASADKERCAREQTAPLGEAGERILGLWLQDERKDTTAGIIAKDADYLDMAAMAKEYLERGYDSAQDWIDNVSKALRTGSAKALIADLKQTESHEWWQGLKKLK